jgi:LysR family transcriptional regulator, hydrogen peroxide-inducible genes activator
MELRQIKYFLAVCEERNFSRAARRCRVARPSLTEAITKLESELGHALFHRGHRNRHTEISEVGLSLKPCFIAVVKAIEEVHELAASYAMRKPMQNDDDTEALIDGSIGRFFRRY